MRAEFDSEANALAITLVDAGRADRSDRIHERGGVDLLADKPVGVEVLYVDDGIEEPLAAAAAKYDLDLEALTAAARSAIAAPDRVVTLDVSAPSPA